VLRCYVEHLSRSTMLTKEVTGLLKRPIRLANLLLRSFSESAAPCQTEMSKYLVEAYPFIDDVEGGSFCIRPVACLILFDDGLVLDLITEVISNVESQMLKEIVDLITQDARSNFVIKLGLGPASSFLRMSEFGLPVPSHFI
jgi:hypothetical protein